MNPNFWRSKRVLITGHTGFKGGWLALWLHKAGALVHGYSLEPPTSQNLFQEADVRGILQADVRADIRDLKSLRDAILMARPEIIFHLAAQPLVRLSYNEPLDTYMVNVVGTVNLLEAVRSSQETRVVVNVTTDKCYENKEWLWGYRETEPLGGHDPYASSKACAELVTAAYRDSFLTAQGIAVATARAGNVIGGGDWAVDRLVPDFFRAAAGRQPLQVRYPDAIRPWQHVLEPLHGYLLLAERLYVGGRKLSGAWNFGPGDEDSRPVRWLLDWFVSRLPGTSWRSVPGEYLHEAGYLKLDSSKARALLDWRPMWSLREALDRVVEWHAGWQAGQDVRELCYRQIDAYQSSGTEAL